MESWTLEHNTYLSCLLDDVSGTEQMVKIRQDSCMIWDCLLSNICRDKCGVRAHFTGSRAEGLDLAGSDDDFMYDINGPYDIEVSESLDDLIRSTRTHKLLVITENVPPCFVMLNCLGQIQDRHLFDSLVKSGRNIRLSSELFMSMSPLLESNKDSRWVQGPSLEIWPKYAVISGSGIDNVLSIRCRFWPISAAEWTARNRYYGWPSLEDKQKIVAFGCHLVPVGHPLSPMKSLEWRLSFSFAERMLVWSFNHTQMQCYALMKLILKEFVKVKCSEENKDVLCSYFIKTFLFWQYEETDPLFWQTQNLRGCLIFLLREFYKCIQSKMLRHYFIPQFNLLQTKLTQGARSELLKLFDEAIGRNLKIFAHCSSLSSVWLKYLNGCDIIQVDTHIIRRRHTLENEHMTMKMLQSHNTFVHYSRGITLSLEDVLVELRNHISKRVFKTSLPMMLVHYIRSVITIRNLRCVPKENKLQYNSIKALTKNVFGVDIASGQLLLATFQLQHEDYHTALHNINSVLSSIPPCANYLFRVDNNSEFTNEYTEMYQKSDVNVVKRAKKTWLFDLKIYKEDFQCVPRAIQIELDLCDPTHAICISPFTYAYYLMFLCYHGLGQYDNRDRALRQLVDVAHDRERCGYKYHSCNIAGHCLLITGNKIMARDLFLKSAHFTQQCKVFDQENAAYLYLSCL